MYIGVASVIALIGRPIVIILRRKLKLSNMLAVVITMTMLVGLFLGLFMLFIPLVLEQSQNLSILDIDALQTYIEDFYSKITTYFNARHIDITQSFKLSDILSRIDVSLLSDFLNQVVSGLGNFGISFFSVLFISFFFLRDNSLFEGAILTLANEGKTNQWKKSFRKIKNLLSRYFIGLVCQIVILFIVYSTGLLIVDIENALVIAFLCALLNLIPYLGPLIGIGLLFLLTITSNLDQSFNVIVLPKLIWVFVIFMVGQLVDNFFSQPIIFSKSVKSHPLEIFLVILITGILFGILGLIIAVPTYTSVKVILKSFLPNNKIVQKLTQNI